MKQPFEIDIKKIRMESGERLLQGAITESYRADKQQILQILNQALATEIICFLRYKNNYFMAQGMNAAPIALEFKEHAEQEMQHADWLGHRIVQLGGVPQMNPDLLSKKAHANYFETDDVIKMIKENLVSERIAIEVYSAAIQWVGNDDPTTRRIFEDILKEEEEHASELSGMLSGGNYH